MFKLTFHKVVPVAVLVCLGVSRPAMAQYGAAVVSYDAGATPASGFTTAAAALGSPERFTGEGLFPGIVSTFNPPFLNSEIVSVGEGGHITLRLAHYAIPRAGREIGVFANVGLIDTNYPNGQADSPASAFGIDSAVVDVSADGVLWTSLGSITFDIPSNGYTDLTDPYSSAPGSSPSDFQQPFTGSLSSFDGLPYSDAGGSDILEVLNGSGGGTWLDISGTGLARVGYIRFSVLDDLNPSSGRNFELDAVSIAHGSVGGVVPEPASFMVVGVAAAVLMVSLRQRSSPAKQAGSGRTRSRRKARRPESSNGHQ